MYSIDSIDIHSIFTYLKTHKSTHQNDISDLLPKNLALTVCHSSCLCEVVKPIRPLDRKELEVQVTACVDELQVGGLKFID